MSWKGVSKAISRLPHQIMSRKSETTVDEDYDRVEKRFNEIVKQVEELKKHSSAFRNAVSELVAHQMNGALLIEQLYDPMMGVQESADGVVKRRSDETSNEAMQAAQDYGLAMTYCRDEILQELDKLDRCVVQPADQMHMIIKTIQKTITKRQHKLIDYDRYRTSLTKMKNIADRSPSEDKQVYKLESQLEVATQDYEYLNDMLKQDLVRFIRLANSFIQPVQDSFYNIQRSVIGGIYGRIYEVIDNHRGYFPTLEHPLPEGYQWRVAQRNVQSELEHLDLLQKGAQANPVLGRTNISLQERAAVRRAEQEGSTTTATSFAAAAPAKRAPPPPPPKPRVPEQPARQYVIALYDLDAQQEGDLSFRKDDKIEVLERTDNTMDWWKGRLGSQVGMFPANYVQEM